MLPPYSRYIIHKSDAVTGISMPHFRKSLLISSIPDAILGLGYQTRFCGIVDGLGKLLYFKYRDDVPDKLVPELEVEKDVIQAMTRLESEQRKIEIIGHVKYCIISLDMIARAFIPFNDLFVLISFDGTTSNLDILIRERIAPQLANFRSALASLEL
jgi:hypothetical protein